MQITCGSNTLDGIENDVTAPPFFLKMLHRSHFNRFDKETMSDRAKCSHDQRLKMLQNEWESMGTFNVPNGTISNRTTNF